MMGHRRVPIVIAGLLACLVVSDTTAEQSSDRPAGLSAFRGRVVDQLYVRLTFQPAKDVSRVLIRRQICDHLRVRNVSRDMVEALDPVKGKAVYDGAPPNLKQGQATFEDRDVKHDRRYAYWVATSSDGPWWGPVLLKVRHPDVWWSADRVEKQLGDLAERHPKQAKLVELGKTYRGLPLLALAIGRTDNAFVATGNIHAGEFGASYLAETLRLLLENDENLLKNAGFVAFPLVNAEKYETLVRGFPSYTRKNLPEKVSMDYLEGFPPYLDGWLGEYQGGGVDLNRNASYLWDVHSELYGQSNFKPRSATYRGPKPFSEPETQAVKKLLETYSPKMYIDLHEARGGLGLAHTDDPALVRRARMLGKAYLTGFYYDRKNGIPDGWVKVRPMPKARYPGSVSNFGITFGVPSFNSEGHWKMPAEVHERFTKTDSQTVADVKDLQRRHYHATREVLRLLASERRAKRTTETNELKEDATQ